MTANTLVIGGRSRVAQSLRRLYPGTYDFVARSSSAAATPDEDGAAAAPTTERAVKAYQDLVARDIEGYSTVINLAGITRGTPKEMIAVNAELPAKLAEAAARAGVSRFIALSSFSVFGGAEAIGRDTPLAPESAYGRSRHEGETMIARGARELDCVLVRCPMLYGAGDSKLEALVRLWRCTGVLPIPAHPVNRSMLHYDLAARHLHETACLAPRGAGLTIDHVADPVTFEYRMAANVLTEASGRKLRTVTLPAFVLNLMSATVPSVARSLYRDSVLDAEDNYFKDKSDSRLVQDLARMATEGREAQ